MHFRTQSNKQASSFAMPAKTTTDMISKYPSSTTTLVASESEPEMERLGVSCWDFAYPAGKCSLLSTAKKNCRFSTHNRSKQPERFIAQTIPARELSKGEQYQQHTSILHKSKKHNKVAHDDREVRTYLISSPTPESITYPQTKTTISTLLSTPNTKLIYLVPQSYIVCPKVCELMRLPRAVGSSVQILPVPLDIEMRCPTGTEVSDVVDAIGVEEVVGKVVKNCKIRSFDGYISFEEEREAWNFLERVGKGVKCSMKKG